jgi:hypothetical protein
MSLLHDARKTMHGSPSQGLKANETSHRGCHDSKHTAVELLQPFQDPSQYRQHQSTPHLQQDYHDG